jgi:hypothetical protein
VKEIDIICELAELKDIDYKNTLAITSLIELLIEKKVITRQEMGAKAREIDEMSLKEIRKQVKKAQKENLHIVE